MKDKTRKFLSKTFWAITVVVIIMMTPIIAGLAFTIINISTDYYFQKNI